MPKKDIIFMFCRYLFLLIIGINISYLYAIFAPLTIYPVFFILNFLYSSASLSGNVISFSSSSVVLTEACIAGAAYYFLLLLNMSVQMPIKTRLRSLFFLILSFLFLNIIRIVLFSALFNAGFAYFSLAHKLIWHLGSTVLLIALWFINIKAFKINAIPIYTDIKSIVNHIKPSK